jgi:hypothetical protein
MMLKCNFIVPGFAKSGTSSLHLYLAMHSEICMSDPKEPHFFACTRQWQRGLEWYNSIFQNECQPRRWYGESSTSYSVWEPALEKIKHWLHKPKFIILLRHPVERPFSHYNWLAAMNLESRSLRKAVREEEEEKKKRASIRTRHYPEVISRIIDEQVTILVFAYCGAPFWKGKYSLFEQ